MALILSLFQQMCVFLVLAYLFSKTPLFLPMEALSNRRCHRLFLYIIFSMFCILGTYLGKDVQGAIANTRAVGAVLGGLLGGPVVGFAVGLTGGLHRYSLGGFTDLACMLATTAEGLLAGAVHVWLVSRNRSEQILDARLVFVLTVVAEVLQMTVILLVAEPFAEAWALVKVIALPMLIANSVGAALFVSIIRDQQTIRERASQRYSKKALQIAERLVGVMVTGLRAENARRIANILLEETDVCAVAVTDTERVLAFVGTGSDHHLADSEIVSQETLKAIAGNKVVFTDGLHNKFSCGIRNDCPLGSALVIPLNGENNEVIGTIKLYESKSQLFSNINRTLGEGIARLLSNQILYGRLSYQRELLGQTELRLAQAQVNPHFLFNTLNTIAAIIRLDADKARHLVLDLSGFLRSNLKREAELSTLEEEIAHVNYYLGIEQVRIGERLTLIQQVEDNCLGVKLPIFTLQPLVENCIKHGITQSIGEQQLRLIARATQTGCEIVIEDSAGLYQSNHKPGLGLDLINKRLAAQFDGQASLNIDCQPERYTRVTIFIPAEVNQCA